MKDEIFEKEKAWGYLTALDLHDCDPEIVENEEKIKQYFIELAKLIDMKRFGDVHVYYFGEDERVKGYSAFQLVETSHLSGHFGLNPGKKTGYGYVDIFSCKSYDSQKAADFTKEYFGAKSYNMNAMYRKFWFMEKGEAEKGRGLKIEITDKLVEMQTQFQSLQIFNTKYFGKMLILDSCVMLTEFDHYAYHEMISHVALNTHPNPKRVLIIGGGDGGVATEVVKHPGVEEIHMCELDEDVTKVCKTHFPKIAEGLKDPRFKDFYMDGAKFVKENKNYDVIIVDSPDPVGPAETLFTNEFYNDIMSALSDDGILVTQSESMYYHQKIIARLSEFIPKMFPIYKHYFTLVPTYPSGEIGFSFCSKKYDPIKDFQKERADGLEGLKYYNSEIHTGSFALPTFIRDKVYKD